MLGKKKNKVKVEAGAESHASAENQQTTDREQASCATGAADTAGDVLNQETREADASGKIELACSSEIEKEIQKLKTDLAETKDKYLRALAEFDNYQKRTLKERREMLEYEGSKIVKDLLAVADNLGLALEHGKTEPEKLRTGLEMIHKLFLDTLGKWGIRPASGLGKMFDPNIYEALGKVEQADLPPGTITNELKQAFFYKDKLLRPGEVVISSVPQNNDSAIEQPDGNTEDLKS